MREFVQRVREMATKAGGAYIPFSQCLEPTATLIRALPATAGGICQALCAKWIAEHANDRSVWNWLCTPGTMNVRPAMIANLMINFAESVAAPGSAAFNPTVRPGAGQGDMLFQDVVTEKYLALYGVVRRRMARAGMTRPHAYRSGQAMGMRIARDLDPDQWNGQNFYVLVSILGPAGGHALCTYVGSRDVCFFDPNFGEFYFDTRAKFKAFMKDFWRISGYRDEFNAYYLLDFGKARN
ncbi:hypothetical protein GWK16_01670 [Roseomonas sp. JC162]|uniref:Peptidase C58 YopT-type domain-containing protein n=1 Tax=Neoroseomonas marina TaxID=1232220 RepID=A0A848E701_9PROT|nr:YopT-type cysteine protease domain-containing protein [Neoroseomonas marina]NMJ39932.1 hypothetical protein [Neoroseomonas marina]